MKKVLTLNDKLFVDACHKLNCKIKKDEFRPTLVIGIANGGVNVLSNLSFDGAKKHKILLKRPSTVKKEKNSLIRYLKYLPYWLLNFIRNIESWYLERSYEESNHYAVKYVKENLDLKLIRSHSSILIVDDAVDSGVTLDTVTSSVVSVCKERTLIKTAVLTVTNESPVIRPDYFLYASVLLRFPWSNDFKG